MAFFILARGHVRPTRRFPYLRFWRIRACGTSRGFHMLFSRLFTGLDEYKASPIVPTRVMGCTGCTVPINLRATLVHRGVGITPEGRSP